MTILTTRDIALGDVKTSFSDPQLLREVKENELAEYAGQRINGVLVRIRPTVEAIQDGMKKFRSQSESIANKGS